MLIKDLSVCKPKVYFDNLNFDFQHCGINIIRGQNGIGKTTIIKEILFNNIEAIFPTPEQQECFIKNRHNLLAYVPQDLPICNVPVIDFLTKGNRKIDRETIAKYMRKFKLEDIPFKANFNSLSGGEKSKLSIICALVKNTPYVFMDEPTNHLDDSAVQILQDVVQRQSVHRTFVIVCHDSRFNPDIYNLIEIKNNEITSLKKTATPLNKLACSNGEKRYGKLIKNILFNLMNIAVTYILIGLAVIVLLFNAREFRNGYSTDSSFPDNDLILCYSVEGFYSESNRVYTTAEKLKIREEDFLRTITFDDIESIAALEGVERLVIFNKDTFYGDYYDATQKPLFMRFPKDITQNFSKMYLYSVRCMLEMGEYPADDAMEVCLSKDIVTDYFKLELDNTIGQSIEYQGQTYKVTGVLENYSAVCMMSHSTSDDSALYIYSQETWEDYLTSFAEEEAWEMLIYTTSGNEASVLNQLIIAFPAHNYYSNYFGRQWVKQYNKDFVLKKILPINLGVAFLMGIIIFLVRKYHLALSQGLLKDYANYYLDRVAPAKFYFLTSILLFGAILLVSVFVNFLYSPYAFASTSILALDLFIAFAPSLIYTLCRIRHVV